MKKDLSQFSDIELLVRTFYQKATFDPSIGHFFTQVIEIDWEAHFPQMFRFWDSVIFGTATYRGNPMLKHIKLNQKSPMKPEHFETWIRLWTETVDELFEGKTAEIAKSKAHQIKDLMVFKVEQTSKFA